VSITRSIRSHLTCRLSRGGLAALVAAMAVPSIAMAEPMVFIEQPWGGKHGSEGVTDPTLHGGWQRPAGPVAPTILPEMISPGKHNADIAGTLTVGSSNNTIQLQLGRHDRSLLGLIGGRHDTVNVLQEGNNQQADIIMINPPPNMNLTLVQPPGQQTLDLLIARLANGQWLVKK
jgi:hypothetical protein